MTRRYRSVPVRLCVIGEEKTAKNSTERGSSKMLTGFVF